MFIITLLHSTTNFTYLLREHIFTQYLTKVNIRDPVLVQIRPNLQSLYLYLLIILNPKI